MKLTDTELNEFLDTVRKPFSDYTLYFHRDGNWWYAKYQSKEEALDRYADLKSQGIKHVVVVEEKVTPSIVAR